MNFLLYIWVAATIYLSVFYLYFHWRLVFYKPKPPKPFSKPVSVVICARNESGNLRKNLPKILSQKNMVFEVLVVNDRSQDDSAEVLARFKMQYPNLTVIENRGDSSYVGKKRALLLGLEHAENDYFILIDADCEPRSDQWLSTMASGFNTKSVILGVSPYISTSSLAGKLTQWETLLTAQHYLSFALAGMPFMGVGRNMGYTREIFEASDKFESHLNLPSGDDDLFVSQMATSKNTGIELHSESLTWSKGPKDFETWWKQKRRHLSTSSYYKAVPSILLGLFGLAQLVFYTAIIPALVYSILQSNEMVFHLVWILVLVKFAVQAISVRSAAKRLQEKFKLGFFPLWEFLVVVFLAIIHIQNKLAGRPNSWS